MMVPLLYAERFENTIKKTYPLDPGGTFHLDTLSGKIDVATHGADKVEIKIYIMSDIEAELKKVPINLRVTQDAVKVSTGKQLLGAKVNVEYTITLPHHLKETVLISRLGDLKARGKYRNLSLKTTTGEIDFKGSFEKGYLESANGEIDAYVRGALDGNLTIKNINGDINVELRSSSDFTITGKSSTGSIRSEFKSITRISANGATITGSSNLGTHQLKLESINGDIKILKQ
jgi:hypothetical protein